MSTSPDILEALLRPPSGDDAIDRKALASLLVEIAESLKPELRAERNGVHPGDVQLEQLRSLLVGREIETLSRLTGVVDDPERLAAVIGRILPTAIAQATSDERMGHVLAPVMERAAESSIRNDPTTLVNILYPTIVPAIRKSIGETIDETFQRLNQSLKYSLTWRGLKWRWEAWRTGASFAEVVLKHTLVYQVEHVFLVHRHTGLLIAHVSAENAVSQDPQLVSSMLVAIQDFVRDSFSGAEHQGVDSLRLGELRLWSEPGPFALLVAVIRGDPPEGLHDTFRDTLSRIHAERHHALENFNGDSAGLGDIEARLRDLVALGEHAPPRVGLARLVIWGLVLLLLILAGTWAAWWWNNQQLWQGYLDRLRAQPGIVITEAGKRDGKFVVSGLRDPLAADPQAILREAGVNPAWVVASWIPYQSLDPQIGAETAQRDAQSAADRDHGNRTVTASWRKARRRGSGSSTRMRWRRCCRPGHPASIFAGVTNADEAEEQRRGRGRGGRQSERQWQAYVERLRDRARHRRHASRKRATASSSCLVCAIRSPSIRFTCLARRGSIRRGSRRISIPIRALDPQFVLERLQASLNPPPGVTFAVDGDRIVAQGEASSPWISRARKAAARCRQARRFWTCQAVRDISEGALGKLRDAIQARSINFDSGKSLPAAGQEQVLDEIATELNELVKLSSDLARRHQDDADRAC